MTFNNSSYRDFKKNQKKKQAVTPIIMGGVALIFIGIGFTLVFLWTQGADSNLLAFLDTETPTFTPSPTDLPPTETPTASPTATETLIPTETPPPTPSEPFTYTVQSGDSLFSIAEEFFVEYINIMVMNGMTNDTVLFPGDEIIIPNPDMALPTSTLIPEGEFEIEYFVLPGDTGRIIADKFLSTIDAIETATKLFLDDDDFDINLIYPGQIIKVPINIATPLPTLAPTETPTP